MPGSESVLVVVAFDFGTTYSGYAFSYQTNPSAVQMNKSWCPGGAYSQFVTHKTPTSVLLDPKGQFNSFGYEVEDKFASLAEEKKHQGWRLFRHFKMILHNDKNLSLQTTVDDLQGRPHPAIEIFSMAIRYLHKHVEEAVKLQRPTFLESDFKYVITVPAIWDVRAKCFMREAAQKAGVDGNRLVLAHEPEVAAMWCTHAIADGPGTDFNSPGSKYMVIDMGGGTADLSVQQVSPDGSIKVIHKASGGPWGGIYVDNQFLEYLETHFGGGALQYVREKSIGDYFDILREFENKKRSTTYHSTTRFVLRIPSALRRFASTLIRRFFFLLFLDNSNSTHLPEEKMSIESDVAKALFEKPVTSLIEHITNLLKQKNIKDIKTILLVGGFGESRYVQDRLREKLTGITLIVPEEPGLTVVKGAVLFGHNPMKVASRVMTYTYGISAYDCFVETKHPTDRKVFHKGKWKVDNVFKVFITANEEITVGHEVSHVFTPNGCFTGIPVYRTLSENPEYTSNPGCEKLGELSIKNDDNVPLEDQSHEVTFIFGNTELFVKVNNNVTGKEEKLILDCLQ